MDIHRCRFVPYPPHPINALAFSHPSDPSGKERSPRDLRLALGRGNGDIEIWNPLGGNWFQETILRGGKDRSIEGLAWIQEPPLVEEDERDQKNSGALRLFSIGYSSSVTEWDLTLGAPARHADGNFGEIWCLAAQPPSQPRRPDEDNSGRRLSSPASQYIAAGCADGTIVLFSTEDNDLRFSKTLGKPPTKKPRILSIAWKDRNTIVAGYSDSMIRIYDIRNKTILRNMSLGKPPEGGNETLVWSIKCLPNGTIVSGDSAGELKVWDANNYSLVQSLHTHEADILDIVTSATGDMIMTSGADRRIIAYKPLGAKGGDKRHRWSKIMHRRYHEHDVKSLAAYDSGDLSIVVSGGLDTVPVILPFREWQNENHRSLSNLPQKPQMSSCSKSRLMMSWWDREVDVWHLPNSKHKADTSEGFYSGEQHHTLVAKLLLRGDENITSAQMSDDGRLIAISTIADVKLFVLRKKREEGVIKMRTHKIELPLAITKHGARLVKLSPDGRWLCVVCPNNTLTIVKINSPVSLTSRPHVLEQVVKLTRHSRKLNNARQATDGLGEYHQTITCADFSADSRIIAVGDVSGFIDAWVLEGYQNLNGEAPMVNGTRPDASSENPSDSDSSDEDGDDDAIVVQGQTWVRNPAPSALPQLNSSVLVLSFRSQPSETKQSLANGIIGLHATRHNPNPHSHDLPTGEARLIAVTARHEILEFEVMQGRLSDWSRRNPPTYLPQRFIQIKERVMGCFWDTTSEYERLWLYGSTWLFVFDLSQDLPEVESNGKLDNYEAQEPAGNTQRKRKRSDSEVGTGARRNTGAGDEVQESRSSVGVGKRLRKFKGSKRDDEQVIELQDRTRWMDEDSDPVGRQSSSLALFRRAGDDDGNTEGPNERVEKRLVNGDSGGSEERETSPWTREMKTQGRPGWWYTFAYRSVFGVVPLGRKDWSSGIESNGQEKDDDDDDAADAAEEDGQGRTHQNLEVAIVERPMWDIELPPRYDGGQDWET